MKKTPNYVKKQRREFISYRFRMYMANELKKFRIMKAEHPLTTIAACLGMFWLGVFIGLEVFI